MAAKPSPNSTNNEDDYSPSSTLIHFDHPLPLLRRPIPAGPTDDPNLGPYVLAFTSPQSFFSSLKSCESKLLEQCEAGVRIGCSISASNKCRPPWWKTLFGSIDFKERSECEEREMGVCLQNSKEKCGEFAKEKCLGPFKWARVACRERKLRKEEVGRLISLVSGLGFLNGNLGFGFELLVGNQLDGLNLRYEVTNFRGCELLNDDIEHQPN
ncbi:uncharacterized protein LOC104894573 [Beta vulgaris subsp. vulgaris]|uniref:uncharacterized protein LOC104894573 n=1 Tax=Beta vulgaris subsp. vulgaris TaxID=3555 RepID=UPI0020368F8B|nr:uncharacterized protein LOC104894573 [Beta vulgaris subsp. vulgaris]